MEKVDSRTEILIAFGAASHSVASVQKKLSAANPLAIHLPAYAKLSKMLEELQTLSQEIGRMKL